jgi:hypothetical protein
MRNLGRVRITVHRISLQVCGLKRDGTLPENGPELVLPDILYNVDNMVSKNVFEYLEPKIMLTRSFFVSIPSEYKFVAVKSRISVNNNSDTFVAEELFDLDNPGTDADFDKIDDPRSSAGDEEDSMLVDVAKKISGEKS